VNSRLWLAIWIGLIVVVVVPWGTLGSSPHWERMAWIPFVSAPVELGDMVSNGLFYVPYGFLGVLNIGKTQTAIRVATGSALALSLATELTQVFSASRFPSMTDVACNVVGAFVGAQWAYRQRSAGLQPK
jgi:glycopeptide antibiotics resistance protein